MIKIHLLHLSDLHLAKKHIYSRWFRRYPIKHFNAVTKVIYKYRSRLDGFIITGDISDTGRISDLQHAKYQLLQDTSVHGYPNLALSRSLRPFKLDGKLLMLLPGNHDRYNFPLLTPGSQNFNEIFKEQWKNIGRGITYHLIPNEESPRLMVICADLTLRTWSDAPVALMYLGRGAAYQERLEKLISITKSKSEEFGSIPAIWAMHFAPDAFTENGSPIPKTLKLQASRKLLEAAKISSVNYIFCGHFHACIDYSMDVKNNVKIFCSGSPIFPEKGALPSLQVIRITVTNNSIYSVDVTPMEYNGLVFQ